MGTLALEAAAGTGSLDAAGAEEEEAEPTELRVEGQEEEEERSAEGRGVCRAVEGFAMAVRLAAITAGVGGGMDGWRTVSAGAGGLGWLLGLSSSGSGPLFLWFWA